MVFWGGPERIPVIFLIFHDLLHPYDTFMICLNYIAF